jgi:hypothetical protein
MLSTPTDRVMAALSIIFGTAILLIVVTLAGFFVTFWSDLLGITAHAAPDFHAYLHHEDETFGTYFKPFLAVMSLALAWAGSEVLIVGGREVWRKLRRVETERPC